MMDRLAQVAMLFKPCRRMLVQTLDLIGLQLLKAMLQKVSEQLMIAVPAPPIVGGLDEEIASFERVEHRLGIALSGNRSTKIAAQLIEDARPHQKLLDCQGLSIQNLVTQVFQDKAVIASKVIDEFTGVIVPTHGKRCQLKPGSPTFCARVQGFERVRIELDSSQVRHEMRGFDGIELQIGCAQFQ
jgi:hypothetical protein